MVPLTEAQAKALAAIADAWPDTEIALIGALALGHRIPMDHRGTDDLDLAVAIPIEGFPGPLPSLEGWRRHRKMAHRFFSPDGQMVDVLPAGEGLIAQGYVEWPTGERMSLLGFDLAFTHNTVEQAGTTTVSVPTAPVLALLKMRAWLDRPYIREKDLGDIAHLLALYVGDDDDRRFEDEVFDLDLAFEEVSSFMLGRDLAQIMNDDHAAHVDGFLTAATAERLAVHGPQSWSSVEDAERALDCFRRGLRA